MIGAREGRLSGLRRLAARALARDLRAFVVPGPEVARARGVDLEAAGLGIADTPRHASVLVVVGELPEGLEKAAAVAYAQMPRPRAILAVGVGDVSPLPGPDMAVGTHGGPVSAGELAEGVEALRRLFAEGAFAGGVSDFDVDAVRTRTEYVCPMHPEVVSDEPGSCPKCGMDLVPRESSGGEEDGHTGHEHTGHGGMDYGEMDHGAAAAQGHDARAHEHAGDEASGHGPPGREETGHGPREEPGVAGGEAADHADHGQTRAQHGSHSDMADGDAHSGGHEGHDGAPSDGEGSDGQADHGGHGGHGHMDHGDGMGFMSMVEMTKDLPRGSDGLRMERVEAPFGPLFPGLPAGLSLTLTLAGDAVEETEAEGVVGPPLGGEAVTAAGFADRLARLDPLSPVAHRLLAVRAVEDAGGVAADEETALARAGALERERAASHLNWLAGFAHLAGYAWLERRAARLQLALLAAADAEEAARLRPELLGLGRRVARTPLLGRKLRGIGALPRDAGALGPVGRARGDRADARLEEAIYRDGLGFEPVVREGDDAHSRLLVRLEEAEKSLDLVRRAGSVSIPVPDIAEVPDCARSGAATVETPRGAARLRVALEGGVVREFELQTPSARHAALVGAVTEGEELADALVGVASLDLSPWGMRGGVRRGAAQGEAR